MTTYTVTGVVPTPYYDPSKPVFMHEPCTDPSRNSSKLRQNGEASHIISVNTKSKAVADSLASVFKAVLEDVGVTKR